MSKLRKSCIKGLTLLGLLENLHAEMNELLKKNGLNRRLALHSKLAGLGQDQNQYSKHAKTLHDEISHS